MEELKDQEVVGEQQTEKAPEENVNVEAVEIDSREQELLEKHGMVEEAPVEEPPVAKEPDEKEPEVNEDLEIKDKLQAGQDLTQEEEAKVHEWSRDEKAMYWKWKGEKQKRQSEVKKRELTELKYKANQRELEEYKEKIERYKNGELEDDEFLTREQAIKEAELNLEKQQQSEQLDNTGLEYKRSIATELGYKELVKNPNYGAIQDKFLEMVRQDANTYNEFMSRLDRLGENEYAGDDLINFVYRSVERSGFNIDEKSKNEKINRIIENSTKPPSTATISSGSSVVKTLDEYTEQDLYSMPQKEYNKLSEKERGFLTRKFGG